MKVQRTDRSNVRTGPGEVTRQCHDVTMSQCHKMSQCQRTWRGQKKRSWCYGRREAVLLSAWKLEFWGFQNIKERMMWISSPWELKADGLADSGGVHHVVHVHPDAVRRWAVPAVWREQDWRCVPLVLRMVFSICMTYMYMISMSWGEGNLDIFGIFLSWERTAIQGNFIERHLFFLLFLDCAIMELITENLITCSQELLLCLCLSVCVYLCVYVYLCGNPKMGWIVTSSKSVVFRAVCALPIVVT